MFASKLFHTFGIFCAYMIILTGFALEITTVSLPSGFATKEYIAVLDVDGGEPPYTWSVAPQVVVWGDNSENQTDVPPGLSDVVAISAGEDHCLAIRSDGTVTAWGSKSEGQIDVPANLRDVIAVDGGSDFSMALVADGTVAVWGSNDYGQADIPLGLTDITAISAGSHHCLALKSDGTVVAWGDNEDGQADVPADLENVVTIDAGDYYSLALKSDGTVVAWGSNISGETDVPEEATNIVKIATGYGHCIATRSDGTLIAWGFNFFGQCDYPAEVTNALFIAANGYSNLAIMEDGSVTAWGYNEDGQINVPYGLTDVIGVSGGYTHSMALRSRATQLQPGLFCSADGVVSGVPIQFGTNTVTFQVRDYYGNIAEKTFEIFVEAVPVTSSGIPIWWLQEYNLATDGSDDFVDTDGDGHSNFEEWIAGTVPTDPASVLKIESFSYDPVESGFRIRWRSVPWKRYIVERGIAQGGSIVFEVLAADIASEEDFAEFADADEPESNAVFYRIRTRLPK